MAMKAMKKGSKAMKAMKAMKGAAKAMKAMKAAMKVSAKLTKRHVYAGKTTKTRGRLAKSDLMKNKRGKVVSKALSAVAKQNPWIVACSAAKTILGIRGWAPVKKGSPFYNKASSIYTAHKVCRQAQRVYNRAARLQC